MGENQCCLKRNQQYLLVCVYMGGSQISSTVRIHKKHEKSISDHINDLVCNDWSSRSFHSVLNTNLGVNFTVNTVIVSAVNSFMQPACTVAGVIPHQAHAADDQICLNQLSSRSKVR